MASRPAILSDSGMAVSGGGSGKTPRAKVKRGGKTFRGPLRKTDAEVSGCGNFCHQGPGSGIGCGAPEPGAGSPDPEPATGIRNRAPEVVADRKAMQAVPEGLPGAEAVLAMKTILESLRQDKEKRDCRRANIKRGSKTFSLPTRATESEVRRDQMLLDEIPKGLSLQAAEGAVEKVRQKREREIAHEPVHSYADTSENPKW